MLKTQTRWGFIIFPRNIGRIIYIYILYNVHEKELHDNSCDAAISYKILHLKKFFLSQRNIFSTQSESYYYTYMCKKDTSYWESVLLLNQSSSLCHW